MRRVGGRFVPSERHIRRVKAMMIEGVPKVDIAKAIGAPERWVRGVVVELGLERVYVTNEIDMRNRRLAAAAKSARS